MSYRFLGSEILPGLGFLITIALGEQSQHLHTARGAPEGLVLPHLDLSCAAPPAPATFSCGQIRKRAGGAPAARRLSRLSSVILCAQLDISFPMAFLS